MEIIQTKAEGLLREYDLTISSEEIEKKMEERLKQIGKNAKIDGFRAGKIPFSVLKQRYEDSVKHEVLDQILQDSTRHLIDQNQLRVSLQPHVNIKEFKDGQDLICTVNLELLPEIEKVDLSQLKFEILSSDVRPEEIDEMMGKIRENNKVLKPLSGKGKAKLGQVVHLSFKGTINDKPIIGGSSPGTDLELGSGNFIPGFEDQLIGLKAGDHKEFEIDFPEDYNAKDLAGKKAKFAVEIIEIKEKVLPEIDEEFIKKFGKSSIDDLKEAIGEQISADYKHMSLLDAKRKILDKFAESYSFDIPKGLVELEFKTIWEQLQKENASSGPEDKKDAAPEEELKKQYQSIAKRRVRLGLLLAEIGRDHNVSVSSKEVEQAIVQEAMKYKGMEKKVIDYYQSNKQAQAALRAPLFEDKVIQLILEKAQINDKKVSANELKKRLDEITEGDDF